MALRSRPISFVPGAALALLGAACRTVPAGRDAVEADLPAVQAYIRDSLPEPFSGQVLLSRRGAIVVRLALGMADSAAAAPVEWTTVFDIGSLTKQFTAAAILRLEEMEKLTVLDSVGRYLAGLPRGAAGLTIHELLTHTAGLPQYSGGDYDAVSGDSLLAWFGTAAPVGNAVRPFSYSNPGYSVLTAIVERASGLSYEEFLRRELLEPARLDATGYVLMVTRDRLATGYASGTRWGTPRDSAWAPDGPWWNLRGNGGLLSRAEDLWRWHSALAGGRILALSTAERLFQPYVRRPGASDRWYGYGWNVAQTASGRVVDHTGGNGVFFAIVRWWRDQDIVLVATSNAFSARAVSALLRRVDRWVEAAGTPRPGPVSGR